MHARGPVCDIITHIKQHTSLEHAIIPKNERTEQKQPPPLTVTTTTTITATTTNHTHTIFVVCFQLLFFHHHDNNNESHTHTLLIVCPLFLFLEPVFMYSCTLTTKEGTPNSTVSDFLYFK